MSDTAPDGGLYRIAIVGGGAGGLELATRLGDTLGKNGQAEITLVDPSLTHLWKPLLHEVAAGTLDSHDDDVEFLEHARRHHFHFRLGAMTALDRERRSLTLGEIKDNVGEVIAGEREVFYDTVVLAVGSVSNDFGTPGVREHCMFLDNRKQADRFQHRLLNRYLSAQTAAEPPPAGHLTVAIVGAGATGVELSAELHHVARRLVAYGFDRIDPERDVKLVLVEAAERILPGAPERVSKLAMDELTRIGVEVMPATRVEKVEKQGLVVAGGQLVPASIMVWAAGIRAPGVLKRAGLESNPRDQVIVDNTLQSITDPNVFAFGDCASCPDGVGGSVPPTAQAAHQQAVCLAKTLTARLAAGKPTVFRYHDHGSMVSLSGYTAIGNLMGNLMGRMGGSLLIEGALARFTYRLLYRKHQRALYGTWRMIFLVLGDWVARRGRSRLKLH
ncbi:MAG: NAD(P)/FAD-dependent oxidoreductase [Leptospirillia bacterium]